MEDFMQEELFNANFLQLQISNNQDEKIMRKIAEIEVAIAISYI